MSMNSYDFLIKSFFQLIFQSYALIKLGKKAKSAFQFKFINVFYTIEHKTRGYTQQSYYLPHTYILQSLGGDGSIKKEQEEK